VAGARIAPAAWAPRLAALLEHPALVVRVYAGTALARLRAPRSVPDLDHLLRQGYPFPDAATQASGKHGAEVSATVRWKGYLAMALGWEGSPAARQALEALVIDPEAPRDIRFGAAVGLRRIADPLSRPALERAVQGELVWWIAVEGERALGAIALKEKAAAAAARASR
jgi:HEAT repeat protein